MPTQGAEGDVRGMTERCYLGRDRMLVKTAWGGWLEVPTFNMDVAVGVIRDGVIEPWTTRAVQELLRPGSVYVNVGSNFGYYVALAGAIVGDTGKVVAIEPNPYVIPYLLRNLFWSGVVGRTRLFGVAAGARDGEGILFSFDPQFMGGARRQFISTQIPDVKPEDRPFRQAASLDDAIWSASNIMHLFPENGEWELNARNVIHFRAEERTLDSICRDYTTVDLIHLDIEKSEPFALFGTRDTISRSPNVKLIVEWSGAHYLYGSEEARACFDEFWRFMQEQGVRVRRIEPRLALDGGLNVSEPLTYEMLVSTAEHGDYMWLRPQHDLW
jgi:FkbM family methyltransferase